MLFAAFYARRREPIVKVALCAEGYTVEKNAEQGSMVSRRVVSPIVANMWEGYLQCGGRKAFVGIRVIFHRIGGLDRKFSAGVRRS